MKEHGRRSADHQPSGRRFVAASVLALSSLNIYGGAHTLASSENVCLDETGTDTASVSASYDAYDGRLVSTQGTIPDSYRDSFTHSIPNAIADPIVRLAAQKGDVTDITALMAPPRQNQLLSHGGTESGRYDNDAHCDTAKEVTLDFDAGLADQPEKALFNDEFYTHITVVHEAIHGLNDEWWTEIQRTKAFDPVMEPRLYRLQSACNDVNRWIVYKNGGHMVQSIDYDDDASLATICSTEEMTLDTQQLREAFACVNEGNMLQDMRGLPGTVNIGHPRSNATELASSVTNVLFFGPEYLMKCFNSQDRVEATLMKQYVKATLELSFAHRPELEHILRQNPKTADALDFLMAA